MALSRIAITMAAFCGIAFGQTQLTTIQDTLFKADGTLFDGSLTIQWSTFDVATGTVVQQQTTVDVVNGNLFVQLAPNANNAPPANVYTVNYQSDGLQQFSESWVVPVSATPLRVSQVRTGVTSGAGGGNGTGGNTSGGSGSGPVSESTVTNLVPDLSQRPVKGVGYTTNSAAAIDSNGAIISVVGNPGDCVLVDGSSGPCGQPQPSFIDAETPGGIVDGSNTTFTLANVPSGSSLMLFRNGLYMTAGSDYTLAGATITFATGYSPQPLDTMTASYRTNTANGSVIGGGSSIVLTTQTQVICSASGAATSSLTFAPIGSCNIPAAALQPGDRIDIQFTFAHSGPAGASPAAGFDVQINWGSTSVIARHGSNQDVAFTGRIDSAVTSSGAQISAESWGTVLSFVPGILNAPSQSGLSVQLNGETGNTTDVLTLTNYTVLRYPAN